MSESPDSTEPNPRSRRLLLGSALVAAGCALALLATSPGLPMAWDEGNAIWRAQKIEQWAALLVDGDGENRPHGPLSREGVREYWPYTTQVEGHPAFYGIVIAAGRSISRGWLGPLDSYRFGPILLFSLAAGAMFYRLGRAYSTAAALGGVAALMLLPRMFAHAHFASFDGPLVSCWILAWAAFVPERAAWPRAVPFGIALGMTPSSKATGWIATLPFLGYALVYRDRAAVKVLAVGVPVALVTFFLLNPPLWHDPVRSALGFFQMNLNRGDFNISTQFLGRMYNLDHPLPWYNTLFWTAVTVPTGILVLMAVGSVRVLRRWRDDRVGVLLVLNALVLLVVRALPGAPPHDGVRLFLPAFAFMAALAGVGWGALVAVRAKPQATRSVSRLLTLGGLLLYAGSASSLFWYAPQWLSYYNLAIGGLPGATARGMEPTYYWDALDRPLVDWLGQQTGPEEKVAFAAGSTENLALMQRWGSLGVEFRSDAPGTYRWYVVQHRPSGWQPVDQWLIERAEPAYRKTIRDGGWGPWRLDVPLVEVYSYEQYLTARKAVEERRSARP
ncbi:MAG: phospholipid carrier-dependent glycosyltransferase [Planctomycetes bacterium]|nr:phospholipid carrier-dependent glycosyltransferase [Planctomycetota bacterium]